MLDWLEEHSGDWIAPFLTTLLTVVFFAFLRKRLYGSRKFEPTVDGVIRPSRVMVWGTTVTGLLLSALLAGLTIYVRDDPLLAVFGSACALLLIAGSTGMAVSLSPYYNLTWDADGVEGAAKQFFIGWRVPRNRMSWLEIANVEAKNNGVTSLTSNDGEKIYYSLFYAQHGQFEVTLKHKRPDLFI